MSAEQLSETCARHRDELLRMMCDEAAEPSAALQTHLVLCDACRTALAASGELAAALRHALRPEPLSDDALPNFRRRLMAESFRARLIRPGLLAVACTAVAAGLLAALMLPWPGRPSAARMSNSSAQDTISLSDDDAATIMAAFACVGWEGPTETSVGLLAEQVSDMAQAVGRETGAKTGLPWGPDDDWDLPANGSGAVGPQATWPLCRAACDASAASTT
jgi:predicted anti-sigma-YlaC factor YlaD